MFESLLILANQLFPNREVLTKEELAQVLECDPKVIYNWVKRQDASKRPPRLLLGNELKYPKREFLKWVVENQTR